jgi:hypothetical protein
MFKDFFFEYFYYRIYYFKRSEEGDPYRGFRGACVIAIVQGLLLFETLTTIVKFFFKGFNPLKNYSTNIAYIGAFAIVALSYYNFKKYDKRMEEFNERWDFESEDDKLIKGFLIILTIIAPFIPMIFITKI